ncbi:RNA-binding S4 domain-containing protein [uncultured Phascolarctobacterium sp.]|uniref:RNA-binding S4 domain-containing protein n=1 Tax=Phascolarctobacterium sp. TaxID=2049039 RepID=UPI0025E5ED46|nr:RNA-binding S4 domain-containing protein [uncultured Phascolarctobacterium sp.]
MEKIIVGITTEFITISNLLKYAGVLETGGQAHEAIEAEAVKLNGVTVTEKRKKVFPQDVVVLDGQIEITVITE